MSNSVHLLCETVSRCNYIVIQNPLISVFPDGTVITPFKYTFNIIVPFVLI